MKLVMMGDSVRNAWLKSGMFPATFVRNHRGLLKGSKFGI